MEKAYDLIIIGTGSAASTPAFKCKKAGWNVAIVDYRPFGGTCALRGCDPKKVLVGAADLVDLNRRMKEKGVITSEPDLDWRALIKFKNSFTDSVPKNKEKAFSKAGIDVYHGKAHFITRSAIKVEGDHLVGKTFLIAAGSKPRDLNIPGKEYAITSDQFLELNDLPSKIIFIGGGYISFEFANIAARAGAKVQILHKSTQPLKRFDRDLVKQVLAASKAAGVQVELKSPVKAIEKSGDKLKIQAGTGKNEKRYTADLIVHGAGRVAELEELNPDIAGVEWSAKGIKVNGFLQSTTNPNIFAAGDAADSGGLPLTPVAGLEGRIVAANLLSEPKITPNYRGVPSVVFTLPPLAMVGLTEKEARRLGMVFRVNTNDTSGWYSSRRIGEKHSGYKVLIEEQSERVLGAHILGPNAAEDINIFALAIRYGLKAGELKEMVYAYPTNASDIPYMV